MPVALVCEMMNKLEDGAAKLRKVLGMVNTIRKKSKKCNAYGKSKIKDVNFLFDRFIL